MSHTLEAFRALIADRLGLAFDDGRRATLAGVLDRRANALGVCAPEYVERLRGAGGFARTELGAIAKDLTVGETYFFRDHDQLRVFREVVIPHLSRSASPVRILSAGCASGEEPYTLAILLRERSVGNASIRAVDVNGAALQKAERMRYGAWSLREVPPDVRERWFDRDGDDHVLCADLRDSVQLEERNLAEGGVFDGAPFHVVFCRNVLMYLTPEAVRVVVDRIAQSLVTGGYLFLGHAESLRGVSQDFEPRHTHGTFYYQRSGARTSPRAPDSWADVIASASERVRSLADAQRAAEPPVRRPDLGPAIDLFERERFADAIALLGALPPAEARDPSVMLLHAVLQTHTGDLVGAEQTCGELLRLDTTSAGAHHLIALCREAAGDLSGAREHDRLAVGIDASFAMPWLHLGLVATRAGDGDAANLAFSRALVLLEGEDPTRILLFGGGFRRDALLALCRSHLAREAAHG
ncbi:MAG: protein-glutamate O-methyltransferase CheR [Labilithrix sp.]|nr:protein-glutamate O-methyltransferase CheR [Labilithrix sp.]